jgi:hypothetical protein
VIWIAERLMRWAYAVAACSTSEDAPMVREAVAIYFHRWRGVRPVKVETRYYGAETREQEQP